MNENEPSWDSTNDSKTAEIRKHCCSISVRETLKSIAQILIPLMIGTFTIVLALQQHNLGKENRKKDLEIAAQLREQAYRLSEEHRKQELTLDEARRFQDLSIAENNQRDLVFNNYIRDLTNVLIVNKYNLSRPLLDSIIRPMTLTILRQIDSSRKILLLKYLYESKMLLSNLEQTRIDLSDADLNGIHFGQIHMENLSLIGASLRNISFIRTDLTSADFQRADLTDSTFLNVTLTNVCFYRTRLIRGQFYQSNFDRTDLSLADLTQSTITNLQFQQSSSYNYAILPDGTQATTQNLFSISNQWKIHPKNSLFLTDEHYFMSLEDNTTMTYDLNLYKHKHLIEREQALLEFYFKASLKSPDELHVDFIYFNDQHGIHQIDRRSGTTIYQMLGLDGSSFYQYLISCSYPSNTISLRIQIFLNAGDNYTDFQFNIQHSDYLNL